MYALPSTFFVSIWVQTVLNGSHHQRHPQVEAGVGFPGLGRARPPYPCWGSGGGGLTGGLFPWEPHAFPPRGEPTSFPPLEDFSGSAQEKIGIPRSLCWMGMAQFAAWDGESWTQRQQWKHKELAERLSHCTPNQPCPRTFHSPFHETLGPH